MQNANCGENKKRVNGAFLVRQKDRVRHTWLQALRKPAQGPSNQDHSKVDQLSSDKQRKHRQSKLDPFLPGTSFPFCKAKPQELETRACWNHSLSLAGIACSLIVIPSFHRYHSVSVQFFVEDTKQTNKNKQALAMVSQDIPETPTCNFRDQWIDHRWKPGLKEG